MKRFFTLILLSTLVQQIVLAAGPTVPASNLTFSSVDGNRFGATLNVGDGAGRIVVVKEGSPVVGTPVNGVVYNVHSNFATFGTDFTAPGEYVVSRSSFANFQVYNLKPGTTYHVAIFEYSGTGTGTTYLNIPLTGSQSTLVAPATQASAITVTAATGNTLTLGWTKGSGTGRIVVARKGAAVSALPVDATNYSIDENFGTGSDIGGGSFVVYKGNATGFTAKNLEPNITYHFAVFEYNGSTYPVFLKPGATVSGTTNAGPSVAPTNAMFSSVEGSSMRVTVTVGNGNRRLFIASKGSPVTAVPVNGATYTAKKEFALGTEIMPGQFVVGAGSANYVDITNLEPNTTYHVRVFEYDADAADNNYYLTSSSAIKSGSTATTPTGLSTGLKVNSLAGTNVTIGLTPGTGAYRTVIMKAGSAVDAVPTDLTYYSGGSSNFGTGTTITAGNYVVHARINGSSFSVSTLTPGVTYHIAIYEFNGYNTPVYSTTAATFSFTVPNEPTTRPTAPAISYREGKSFRLSWTNGNGAMRIIVAKKGSAVTAKPVDKDTYTANERFTLGQEIATGEYVVGITDKTYIDLKDLELNTTYHFAVFEYNIGSDGKPDYLTSSFLAHNGSTIATPTVQGTITGITGIQATQATFSFTAGNGDYRLLVMKKAAAVSASPVEFTRYNASPIFGGSSTLIADGCHVVYTANAAGSQTVTGLDPNTTYHIAAFEFNGVSEPSYLRTAVPTASFTTGDVPGATTPTVAASGPTVSGVDGNKLTLNWTNGNGARRLVVMKAGGPVTFVPAAGNTYAADASFGNSTDLGGGQFAVLNNNANTVDITNLQPGTIYHYTIFEYDGTGALVRYLTSAVLSSYVATFSAPSLAPSAPAATSGAGSVTITWTNGNGSARLVVMKEGSAVGGTPVTLSFYPPSATFKSGTQIAIGEYVVYANTGSSVTVTGLDPLKTYYYSIFEYNGVTAPVYNFAAAQGFASAGASLPISLLYFKAKEENGDVLLSWATAQESNNKFFTIEKSTNGGSFAVVKELPGAINSDRKIEYNYTDVKGATGKAWYRLKQTDLDGRYTYSDAVLVNPATASGKISLSPNPAQSQVRIVWPGTAKDAVLVAYTANGIAVKQEKLVAGRAIDCAGWKPGTYYITILVDGKQYQSTLVKQ